MRFPPSTLVLGAMLCFVLGCVAGCHSKEQPPPLKSGTVRSSSYDTTHVHLALMPTADCFPFYYAKLSGIYEKLGLNLDIHTYDGQLDCDTALRGKWMDGGYADVQRLKSFHKNLQIVSYGKDRWALFVAGSLRVRQVMHLDQRLVAIARNSSENVWLDELLSNARLKVDNVFHIQVNNVNLRAEMLAHRQIDAAMLRWPYTACAFSNGDKVLALQDRAASNACFVVNPRRHGGTKLDKKALMVLRKGYAMAVDSIRLRRTNVVKNVLTNDYGLPADVADTVKLEFGGFFR